MATAAEDLENDGGKGADDENAGKSGAEGGDEEQGNGEDSPYAPLAKDMGWTPRDQFQGDPEAWKDAETFIRDGRDIQRETSRELKTVRAQLDTIAKTSASIVEQQVKERVDELAAKYTKAVEDGDANEAFKLSGEIHALKTETPTAAGRTPPPEAQAFAERNGNWFNKPGFEYATTRAVEIANSLAAQGYTEPGQQLKIVEQRMRQEMPQLYKDQRNGKPAPGVNSPGSRTSGTSNRAKGFSDMPVEAQNIAKDMEARGVIKSKDDYAKNYFANLEGKA